MRKGKGGKGKEEIHRRICKSRKVHKRRQITVEQQRRNGMYRIKGNGNGEEEKERR